LTYPNLCICISTTCFSECVDMWHRLHTRVASSCNLCKSVWANSTLTHLICYTQCVYLVTSRGKGLLCISHSYA
jgi:hypothetical protein